MGCLAMNKVNSKYQPIIILPSFAQVFWLIFCIKLLYLQRELGWACNPLIFRGANFYLTLQYQNTVA